MDVSRTPDVKPRITEESEKLKTWKLADIVDSGHLRARRCPDTGASPTKVCWPSCIITFSYLYVLLSYKY